MATRKVFKEGTLYLTAKRATFVMKGAEKKPLKK